TNCYYNPDVDLGVPELIKKYTGNLQSYNVTTEDGYILTVFRVFKQNPIGVILLQPPISAGSIAWTSDGNQSLAFTLWNMGYDVWLTNHRGASYSRKHVYLTDTDPQYWDYSFHEIATYDFEVQFELIRNETNNSRIIYVGYSMSATEALIYASLKPEEAQNFIKSFILIAPTSKFLRLGEFMTFEAARWIADYLTFVPYIVNFFDSVIMGWTPDEMDPILYPYIFSHHGRGITNKMLYHYIQIIASGNRFLMYDYGNKTNTVLYGSGLPPDYPLERILAPVYIIYGEKDALATPT
ncbi:Abhydrolase 1 domain containing protein, partial [Asbolus verrucosus]